MVFSIFILFHRIKKKIPKEVKELESPYLLLSNHVGFWDPFLAGHFLPNFTHFVSSDTVFRNKLFSFFLTRLGTIPKKKNMRDTKVIRDIIGVIRQGENVGIFPEAVRTWSGSGFNIDESIVKLIMLLKVPVVVCNLKGMNLFNPRWSRKLRKTRVEVGYELVISKDQAASLNPDEIFKLVKEGISHDEVEYQKSVMNEVTSNHKAENINHALYVCPDCEAIDSFIAEGNDFKCQNCSYDIHINDYSFFERITNGKLYFDNIRDWFNWEEKWLLNHVSEKVDSKYNELIFEDTNSLVYKSNESCEFKLIGTAYIKLYINRIDVVFSGDISNISFNFNDLQTINPQVSEMIEIYYNDEAYRITGGRPGVSGLKWEVAVNAIWKKMGQEHKLSKYIVG